MERKKQIGTGRCAAICLAWMLIIAAAVMGAASYPALEAQAGENVIHASSVFLHPAGVAFWGWDTKLCSALVREDGELWDFVTEATMPSRIMEIAIDGNYIYMSTFDGLCKVDLAQEGQGSAKILKLYDSMLINGFSLYDGYAYYRRGNNLVRVPDTGGEEELLREEISDYLLTEDGIYYTDPNGGLFLLALDGSKRELLAETPAKSSLSIGGNALYFWSEKNDSIWAYSLANGSVTEYRMKHGLKGSSYVWPMGDKLLYDSEELDSVFYSLTDGSEVEAEGFYLPPDRFEATYQYEKLYYAVGDTLYIADAQTDTKERLDMNEILAGGVSAGTDSAVTQEDHSGLDTAQGGGYNIAEGISLSASEGNAMVATSHFYLYLPADIAWDYEILDESGIRFFYIPGRDSGYDGTFLTLRAYDWSDNSYEDLPSYQIAGLSAEKKYVAILPTDVRYDFGASGQAEEYQRLMAVVERMDRNRTDGNNPFFVLDP